MSEDKWYLRKKSEHTPSTPAELKRLVKEKVASKKADLLMKVIRDNVADLPDCLQREDALLFRDNSNKGEFIALLRKEMVALFQQDLSTKEVVEKLYFANKQVNIVPMPPLPFSTDISVNDFAEACDKLVSQNM